MKYYGVNIIAIIIICLYNCTAGYGSINNLNVQKEYISSKLNQKNYCNYTHVRYQGDKLMLKGGSYSTYAIENKLYYNVDTIDSLIKGLTLNQAINKLKQVYGIPIQSGKLLYNLTDIYWLIMKYNDNYTLHIELYMNTVVSKEGRGKIRHNLREYDIHKYIIYKDITRKVWIDQLNTKGISKKDKISTLKILRRFEKAFKKQKPTLITFIPGTTRNVRISIGQ